MPQPNYLSEITSILHQISQPRPKTGKEVLDTLVFIADQIQSEFIPAQLTRWWEPFSGVFSDHVFSLLKKSGLNEHSKYDIHEPLHGYNRQIASYTKKDIAEILKHMTIINQKKLDRIKENEVVCTVTLHLWYDISCSQGFYDSRLIDGWFEELGFPKNIASILEKAYIQYQKILGKNDEALAEKEILNTLLANKINPEGTALEEINPGPSDLFAYSQRYFAFQREKPYRSYRYPEPERITHTCYTAHPDLILAFIVYSTSALKKNPEPVAYTFLKTAEKNNQLLLPYGKQNLLENETQQSED